jgi:hypothetical protein
MIRSHVRELSLSFLACALWLSPSVGSAAVPVATPLPVVPGEPATRSTPFIAWFEDLPSQGYTEVEYQVSGVANIYAYADNAAQRPDITVLTPNTPYATRIIARYPSDPARFNGTVYVEVLNATAGWDGDPIWQATHEHIIRSGIAWVGVTTKPVTVNFLKSVWGKAPWPTRNATRYGSLSMPAFGQVWDMMSQVGELLKTPQAAGNPLAGYDVQRLLMVGYSQSAAYQITYVNSFHDAARMPNGTSIYDGYYISAGGARAKHVTAATAATENLPLGDARNKVLDAQAPIIKLQTQTEVVNFPSYPTRQSEADSPWLRTYEVAGGSHVDSYLNFYGGQALVRDLGLPPSFCPSPAVPYNPVRTGYYQAAALDNLDTWARLGVPAPPSRFLQLTTAAGAIVLARDTDGNAIGGVRPPELEVPLGTYLESNTGPGFCGLFGGFAPFDATTLKARYRNHGAYVSRFMQAVTAGVTGRYLLPEDAAELRTGAATSNVGKHR